MYGILRRNALLFPKSLKPAFGATVACRRRAPGRQKKEHTS